MFELIRTRLVAVSIAVLFAGVAVAQPRRGLSSSNTRAPFKAIPVTTVETAKAASTKFKFRFKNQTGRNVYYQEGDSGKLSAAHLTLDLYKGKKRIWREVTFDTAFKKHTLKPGDSLEGELNLGHYLVGRDSYLVPGHYVIRAVYNVKRDTVDTTEHGLTPMKFEQTLMTMIMVESLPKKMTSAKQYRVHWFDGRTHYRIGADLGLGRTWEKKATLFFATRISKPGEKNVLDTPQRILRPFRVNPKSTVDTKLYHAFPNTADAIIVVFVLVTEPDKTQHYLVVDLNKNGNLKLPEVLEKRTLKQGKTMKLYQKDAGRVQLVPVDK